MLCFNSSRSSRYSHLSPASTPNLVVLDTELSSISSSDAQAKILSVPISNGDEDFTVLVRCMIMVHDSPLQLQSNITLLFDANGSIQAAEDCTSSSLLYVENASSVSIACSNNGPDTICPQTTIDGSGKQVIGIYVRNSSALHFDAFGIKNCFLGGIVVESSLPDGFESTSSITRCSLLSCGQGITISSSIPFICANNHFRCNSILGMLVQGPSALIIGNMFAENACDLLINMKHGVIMQNVFGSSSSSGPILRILPTSTNIVVIENNFLVNLSLAVDNLGTGNIFIANIMGENEIIQVNEVLGSNTTIDCSFLINKFLHASILLPFQFEIFVWGSLEEENPSDVDLIRQGISAGKLISGNSILVVRVEGHFVSKSPKGLVIPMDTCVILSGVISADIVAFAGDSSNSSEKSQLIVVAQTGHVSLIGGTLDCRGVVDNAISALGPVAKTSKSKSSDVILVDSVEILNSKTDAVYLKGRKSAVPFVMRNCTILNSGMRGIWVHVTSNVVLVRNTCKGSKKDGIDMDAGCKWSFAIGNICTENLRHGVFIEEACSNNIVLGNECFRNVWSGIHIWNEAVKGFTSNNILAFNICKQNTKGVSIGGRSEDKTSTNNFSFNDSSFENSKEGLVTGNRYSKLNTFSYPLVYQNRGEFQIVHWK